MQGWMKFIEMFMGPNNETSSKRIIGTGLIVAAITGAFTGMDNTALGYILAAGCSMFGIAAVTKT